MKTYIFDVDGTLTPSRQPINSDFAKFFNSWMWAVQEKGDQVMLVTGSDRPKTLEQLGEKIVSKVDYACFCMGNQVYHNNQLIHDYQFQPPAQLLEYLEECLKESPYSERYGNHIENRGNMINFSVVGRNAVGEQRTKYYFWDKTINERETIASIINKVYSKQGVQASVGGETGIDISGVGKDKSQCMQYIQGQAFFFGDRMDKAGNDFPLANALRSDIKHKHRTFHVSSFYDTENFLKNLPK